MASRNEASIWVPSGKGQGKTGNYPTSDESGKPGNPERTRRPHTRFDRAPAVIDLTA
jgi:hypothetical protein